MGLLHYLQKTIASCLRPWILQKDLLEPLLLHLHFSQIALELQPLELDCASINSSSLLSTSRFLLRQARLDYAKLTVSFFRSPGIFLEVSGLHFVCQIRPPEDSVWGDREKQSAEVRKMEAISALDPQGAAVHTAAERHAREEATTSILKELVASLLLQALRWELHDSSVELHPNAMDSCSNVYSLSLERLVLEEERQGLAGALTRRLANIFTQADQPFFKTCFVQKFGLQLSTFIEPIRRVKSTQKRDGFEGHIAHRQVSKDYLLLWKTVTLISEFENNRLNGLDALFAETVIQLSLAQAEAFSTTARQLQGSLGTSYTAHESEKRQCSKKSTKHLWQRAVEKITSGSGRKFKDAVAAGVLRHRYTQLYASWLLRAGEGVFEELNALSSRKNFQRKKFNFKSLERDLSRLQQELPVEAIVLARNLARRKVLTNKFKLGLTAQPIGFAIWNKAVFCLLAFCEVLKKVCKTTAVMLKRLSDLLYVCGERVCTLFGLYRLILKCIRGLTALRRRFSVLASYFASQSNLEYSEERESLHKRKLFRLKNTKGRISFNSTFHMGSVTFIGCSGDYLPRNGLSMLLRGSWLDSLEGGNLPGVHFTWGDVSVVYSFNDTSQGFELVCGYLQGQVLTVPVSHSNTETAIDNADGQGWVLSSKKNGAKFLQSGPAPQTRLPEMVKDHFEPIHSCERDQTHEAIFMNFWRKEKVSVIFAEETNDRKGQPFILFSFENTQTNCITPDKNSDMLMCSLAVGCLDCRFNMGTFTLLGLLVVQFLGIVKDNKHCTNDDACQLNLVTSTSSPTEREWETLYADQLKQFISTVVLRRKIWFSTAVAGPELQFSGCFVSPERSDKAADGTIGFESVSIIRLGTFEVTIWPAKVEQESVDAENLADVSRQPLYKTKKAKVWVRKPPSPRVQCEKVVESSSHHERIGNNVIISLDGAAMSFQALNGSEDIPLAGPIKMLWECSLCRDHFISPFGACDFVSAAAMGTFSSIPMGIVFEEIQMLFEALKRILTMIQQFSDLKRSYSKAFKKSDNWQVLRHGDSVSTFPENCILSQRQLLYFAASVEIQVEEFDCILSDRRISKGAKIERDGADHGKFYTTQKPSLSDVHTENINWLGCLGVHDRMNQVSVKRLWAVFSWGDGCELLASSGFDHVSLFIENGGSMKNSKNENVSRFLKSGDAVCKTKEDDGNANGKCQLVVKQFSFRLTRPWCLSEASNDMEALNSIHLDKHKHLVLKNKKCWMLAGFELEQLQLYDGESNRLVNKALSRVTGASSLTIDIALSNDYESISAISKGGILVLHTKALFILLQEWKNMFFPENVPMETNNREISSTSFSNFSSMDESSPFSAPTFGRSLSLPLRHAQERQLKHQRLYSAPIESRINEQQDAVGSKSLSSLPENFSMELQGLYFLLAQTSTAPAEQEGLLLEVSATGKLQRSATRQSVCFETKKFSICSLQVLEYKHPRRMKGHLPRFGSSSALAVGSDSGRNIKDLSCPLKDLSLFTDEGINIAKSKHSILEDSEEKLSREGGINLERENNYILENLNISLRLDDIPGYLGQSACSACSDGWRGSFSLIGLDVGITTSEMKLILVLISSLSTLPSPIRKSESKASKDLQVTHPQQMSDHAFEVPDGSIVAVKDVQEHLYMAVEKADKNYRLIGVLHYSLVGERALFKVKYQKNPKDSSQLWFSLHSVGANNTSGEPFRVHYRPGSGLADVSSTNDGSWELWSTLPYKHSAKEEDGDMDLYGDLNSNLVHLVNQKSKQGLTLASGGPMMVKRPGSPFKFKVLQLGWAREPFAQVTMQTLSNNAQELKGRLSSAIAALPKVEVKVGRIIFTLLHETGRGKHLLPLLRGRLEDTEAVMHIHSCKIRLIGDCKFVFEYLEAHVNRWSMIIQPVNIGLFYRLRTSGEAKDERVKLPASFFARCKKVDITVSETSLDVMLFVIGILNLAGPYNIKHSPVLATSCMVENHTGLELCCSFESKDHKQVLKIPAWRTDMFLVRSMISRRDSWPAKLLSSVSFNLEKEGIGASSPVLTSLMEPSLTAVRTRLERKDGHKKSSGPIIVVDVSKQGQDGIIVTVSPMIRIHNASGLSLELRCRRPNSDAEGAIVLLNDGDNVDDSMGAFDALNLEGELRKALSSFNLGDYLLSVRPTIPISASSLGSAKDDIEESEFDWSEDIKGAKPIHISGFLGKLQYGLRKSLKGRNISHSFGTVFCGLNVHKSVNGSVSKSGHGMHILVRTTSRYVPLSSMNPNDKPEANRSVVAWQEQKELVLLPTLCVHNFLHSKISIISRGASEGKSHDHEMHIEQGCKVSMYADLAELVFSVQIDDFNLTSKYINIGEWGTSLERSSTPADYVKDLEIDLDFGENYWYAKLKVFRANDGVLQVQVYSQYAIKNTSDIALLCCLPRQSRYFWGGKVPWSRGGKVQWPLGEAGIVLHPGVKLSLLGRSSYLLLQMAETLSETTSLDLDSFSGSTELSLNVCHENGMIEETQMGVRMELTAAGNMDPTRTIKIGSRYIVLNDSQEPLFICQDGFQEDENAALLLKAGEHVSVKTQYLPGHKTNIFGYSHFVGSDLTNSSVCSIRFRLQENGWDWTGPVCASALGSFSLRICKNSDNLHNKPRNAEIQDKAKFKFISVDVEDESPSLVIRFRLQSADTVPYRIENALSQASIFFYQKGVGDIGTTLEPGQVVGYAWDNLSQPHKLVVSVPGTQMHNEIKLDKLGPWKSFRAMRHKQGLGLQLPFENQSDMNVQSDVNGTEVPLALDSLNVGYEIVADGFQRVLRVCEDILSSKLTQWQSHISFPSARMDFRVPVFGITLFENAKQKDIDASRETVDDIINPSPIISMRMSSLLLEILNTQKHVLLQLKVQSLSVDEKWQGAPFAAMLRVHSEDRFKKGETVLQMAAIISNQASNPIHVKYSSVLLQAIDVNLDEETLMKLVPFYRYSLAESTSSRQIYFERLEIHPIKIVASFLPGQPLADYTSTQETFRTLLHSIIKVPSIRGYTVELNGVLLSHALLSFRQLAIKCAQHYSWYAMRAIYIAKGSKLLPPAFASLFDDSAASSLDVFFDPSNGSIDLQGLTLGMFNLLSDGLNKRGFSGTSRYIGDLERTMKTAGSNILFAILTEVSDNVLKGAETGGLDGMVKGFRRGILNVSMEPSLLRTAVVKGGSSRRIKLDHSAGTDEAYVEGYLQAMLDTLFKQNYLKVKVVDDQVLLKNLPPSSLLIDEIIGSVKDFLVREGLLAGETSAATMHSWRRLQGENDKRIIPAVVALCEQLFVIFAVRALRNQARSWVHWGLGASGATSTNWGHRSKEGNDAKAQPEPEGGQENTRGMKGIIFSFVLSSAMAHIDGRLCRHIPNTLARRVVSGFLLSFVE